ncbi:MAG TPA: hypothetical protein VKI65_04140 [Gemmataceae bacterium]|nr:hypothetical protein [Gemmataceae bacterium]
MTTLLIPSCERRFLQTVEEEIAAAPVRQWSQQTLRFCFRLLRDMREGSASTREMLEATLAGGVEARSFSRNYGPLLPAIDDRIGGVRELVRRLSPAEDPGSEGLLAELHLLEQEMQDARDLLVEALSRASEAPAPVDWNRVRVSEEAYARGETKLFSRR